MEKLFKDLWYSYESQKNIRIGEEEKAIYEEMNVSETNLRQSLTEAQKEWLDKYENCFNELFSIAETEAFAKGIRFGVDFILEVLYK